MTIKIGTPSLDEGHGHLERHNKAVPTHLASVFDAYGSFPKGLSYYIRAYMMKTISKTTNITYTMIRSIGKPNCKQLIFNL